MFNIIAIIKTYGYTGLFFTTFLESALFFWLPGDGMIFMAGFMASEGAFSVPHLLLLFITSSFLSGIVAYYIGKYLHILTRYKFFKQALREVHIERARKLFNKRGLLVIVVSKFFPLLRTFVPVCIGITGMPTRTFLTYNAIGSILAPISFTIGGYYLGQIFPWIQEYIAIMIMLIIVLSALPLLKKLLPKRKQH
jgi:membrane-associated protein